jgi:hypothetical protein
MMLKCSCRGIGVILAGYIVFQGDIEPFSDTIICNKVICTELFCHYLFSKLMVKSVYFQHLPPGRHVSIILLLIYIYNISNDIILLTKYVQFGGKPDFQLWPPGAGDCGWKVTNIAFLYIIFTTKWTCKWLLSWTWYATHICRGVTLCNCLEVHIPLWCLHWQFRNGEWLKVPSIA